VIQSRRKRRVGNVVHKGERGSGETWGKRPVERSRRRREDNIKMVLKKWDGALDRIDLDQDRDMWRAFVNTGSIKYAEFLY
jgi:hypothetical protein